MDLRRLRTFVTVAEQGSVSKAALHLRIAQPALSRQIKDLQQELGLKLFDHVGRRLVLTGEGEQLLGDFRSLLGHFSSVGERAELLRRGDSGVLKVAASPVMIERIFSKFLHRYAEHFPNVQVRLTEAVGLDQLALLERGEVHLGITVMHGDLRHLGNRPLPPIELLAACHASLRLGNAGTIDISRLAPYPLLLLDSGYSLRKKFDAACRLAGFAPNILMQSRAPHTLLALAESGHGVAIISSYIALDRYAVRIARVAHQRKPLREERAIFWDKRRMLPHYAQGFCELLAEYMRKVFPTTQLSRGQTDAAVKRKRRSVRPAAATPSKKSRAAKPRSASP